MLCVGQFQGPPRPFPTGLASAWNLPVNLSYMGDPASLSPVFLSARASWTKSQDPDCTFCRILGGQYSPGNRAQGTEDCLPAYPGLSVAKIWTGCTCGWVIGEGLGLTLRSGTPCVPGRGKLKDAEGKLYKHNSRVQTHCEAVGWGPEVGVL